MDLKEAALTGYDGASRHPWELARIEVVLSLLRECAPQLLSRSATLLDVGCGDTFVVEQLARHMPHARFQAVDSAFTPELLEAYARRFQERAMPIQVFPSLEHAARSEHLPVDFVLLMDVIEHVADDVAFLERLGKHPGIGGQTGILITVPAFQGLFSAHDVFLGHYRRYDRSMLTSHARRAGLVPVASGYFFASLIPPRIATRLVERLTGRSSARGVGDWRGHPFTDRLWRRALVADFTLGHALARLGLVLPGLSCYAICRASA